MSETQTDYIDVRGAYPTYVKGNIAIQLRDQPRSITIEQAREIVKEWLTK